MNKSNKVTKLSLLTVPLILITALAAIPVFAGNRTPAPTAMISTGYYSENFTTDRPLLALSSDSGATWTYPGSIMKDALPKPFILGYLNGGASCNGSTCIAAGSYNDGTTERPLLALSKDSGATWTYPSKITKDALPMLFSSGGLYGGASCNGTTCIAAGAYSDGFTSRPLLALSSNNGATWTYPSSINTDALPTLFSSGGLYGGASCNGKACIAAGAYNDGTRTRPLLAVSKDSGATWTYPRSIMTDGLPTPFIFGHLTGGASCSDSTCIATGGYYDGTKDRPLLALSSDNGATWTYPRSITNDALPTPFIFGYLNGGASCNGSNCIAAGSYNDGSTDRPLLVLSNDSGATWTYPSSITRDALPTPFIFGYLTGGASCNGSTCIAAGSYNDGSTDRPLLALSRDSGATWTYPSSITRDALPTPFIFGYLNGGASCNGSTCIAAGSYNDGTTDRPLLALSSDSGATWTYPSSITTDALPALFGSGRLEGGANISKGSLPISR